jgi:hypothetical protein
LEIIEGELKLKQNNYRTKNGKALLQKKIDLYFETCDKENFEPEKDKKTKKPYTLTGLLCFLDMSGKELTINCGKTYICFDDIKHVDFR